MLVRILSNIASFLGNARHRAILVSCLVLAFATSSVVGILAVHEGQARNAATVDDTTSSRQQQEETIWLGESQVDSKDTLEKNASSDPDPEPTPKQKSDSSAAQQEESEATIRLSSTEITMAPNALSAEINAGVIGDNQEDVWELTLNSQNPDLKIANSQTADKIFTFQLKSTENIKPGEYLITVKASKGEDKKITATLTVIVPDTDNAL